MDPQRLQEKLIFKEQVKQLYGLAPLGIVATLMNSVIVFFVMKEVIPFNRLLPWLAVILGVTALRAVLIASFRSVNLETADAPTWARRFIASLFLIGAAWGGIGFLPFSFSLPYQVFIAFVLGGMVAGASTTLSKVRWGYLAFSVPALVPLSLHFLLIPDPFHRAMSAMTLLFLILIWRLSHHNYAVNRTSLLLRFENQEMIEILRRAKEDVEALNSKLMAEIGAKLEAEAGLKAHQEHLERIVKERTADLVAANEQLENEIEERKQIEKALRESRERLDLAQRAGRVGVFDWDITRNRVIWTAQLEELFGLQPGGFEGDYQGWARRLPSTDRQELQARFRNWMRDRVSQVDFEYRFVRPGGETRWMAANARIVYHEDGTPVRMIGTMVDVTDLKDTQEKLTAAKDAAEAGSLSKSEFLANMSHEMRTPLAGALGMIKLVLDMAIGNEERKLLEMARRSAESLLRIIADVLDFSRLEAGMMKLEKRRFSVCETVRTAVEVVSLSAIERGLHLSWNVEEAVAEAEGDEGRLRQVLVNLLGNAVKFTERGSVEVTARPFRHPEAPQESFILFSVSDTGIGIPADQLDRIFGKFTQLDSSLARGYGGTGLGLALSRQIVEKSGGRIWAESSVGVGSTFYFTLPADASPGRDG